MKIYSIEKNKKDTHLIKIQIKLSGVSIWCDMIMDNGNHYLCLNNEQIISTIPKDEFQNCKIFPKNGLSEL